MDLAEDYIPGNSLSDSSEELLPRGRGGATLHMNFGGQEMHVDKHASW